MWSAVPAGREPDKRAERQRLRREARAQPPGTHQKHARSRNLKRSENYFTLAPGTVHRFDDIESWGARAHPARHCPTSRDSPHGCCPERNPIVAAPAEHAPHGVQGQKTKELVE